MSRSKRFIGTTLCAIGMLWLTPVAHADFSWFAYCLYPNIWEDPPYYVHDGGQALATVPFDVWGCGVAIDDGPSGATARVYWKLSLEDWTLHQTFGIYVFSAYIDSDIVPSPGINVTLDANGHWQHLAHGNASGTMSGTREHENGFEGEGYLYESISAKIGNTSRGHELNPSTTSPYVVVRP